MSHNLLENSQFLELIDWQEIVTKISSHAHLDITKEAILKQLKAKTRDEILQSYDNLDFFITNIDHFLEIKDQSINFIPHNLSANFLSTLKKSSELSIKDINSICLCLELYNSCLRAFKDWSYFHNFEFEQSSKDRIKNKFITPFRKFVSKTGHADYEKHPLLKELYLKLHQLEEKLRETATTILRLNEYSNKIQFEQFDIVNERFTIPIRSDSYNASMGTIIGRSTTGHTLYVEPINLSQMNNERLTLLNSIDEVISKICRNYTEIIQSFFSECKKAYHLMLFFDITTCNAFYSEKENFVRPTILDDFELKLEGAYHPLLDNAVSNDFDISKDKLGLVISGPNTGGKTVALKTLVISHLFMHLGLGIPAQRASLYPVNELYFYSHDQQDLSQGLSSFASEAKNYLELLSTIGENSLIVIDEVFNSTSSEEASALALSLLKKLHEKSHSKIILSTHHQLLKTHIHSSDNYVSAYVGYDMKNHCPTYKVFEGEPGSSMALTIFKDLSKRFGVENDIPNEAKQILDKKQFSYEKLLEELSQKKSKLDSLLRENRELNIELKNKNKSMQGIVRLEKERLVNTYEKKVKKILSQAEELKKNLSKGEVPSKKRYKETTHGIQNSIAKEKEAIFGVESIDDTEMPSIPVNEIKTGQQIFSKLLRKDVQVLNVNSRKKEVQILNGKLKVWMPAASFAKSKSTNKKKSTPNITINIEKKVQGSVEIDCRGLRLEDFQDKVETSINELINGDIPFLTIIHGHGTGILKKWLRDYIRTHRELQFDNNEGNDGCTRVTLKS